MDFGTGRVSNFNNNGINVNSRLFASFSDTAMVTVGAWNQNLSLKVHPFKGMNADGLRQYEQDMANLVKLTLSMENATAVAEGCKEVVWPAYEAKQAASISILLGYTEPRKMLTLGTDGTKFYLTVAVNLDANNVASDGDILTHVFNTRKMHKNLDLHTGNGEEIEIPTDFINFMRCVESVFQLQPILEHSLNYNQQLRKSFVARNNPTGGLFGSGGNSGFQSQQMGGTPAYQPPVTSSFNDFMEQS